MWAVLQSHNGKKKKAMKIGTWNKKYTMQLYWKAPLGELK